MTRVIHTGDTHVGYRQYHSPERREDFLSAFEQVVADAVADDVDAVVHAGDLFHDRRPGLVDLQGVIDALRTLAEAEIPFLAVVGNHETKRDAQWLDLFEDLGLATRLGSDPVEVGEAALYGLDFVPRSRRDDLAYDFADHDAEYAALVSHGMFEPFAHADWDTHRLLRESTVEFDVLLLGDNHALERAKVRDTLLTYCGSTERASASERDERGYNLVTFEDRLSVSRRGLSVTREFVFVDLELGEGEGEPRVREAVRQHDLADAVVIVTITGEGDPVSPAGIEELATERGALVARVNDRREIETESERDVSFAEPDEAVRERIAEMGLSEAAHEIDETVRASKVADSNVRETVEARVRDRLESDLRAFESADEETAPAAEGPSQNEDPKDGETEHDGEAKDDGGTTTESGDRDGQLPTEASDEPPQGSAGDGESRASTDDPEQSQGSMDDEESQASMEEYL